MKATNNLTEYVAELKVRLIESPELEGYRLVFVFSEVHSLLLKVNAVFLLENAQSGEYLLYLRKWDTNQIQHEHGLYFYDELKFKHMRVRLNGDAQVELKHLLSEKLSEPKELEGIVLDGFEYRLMGKNNDSVIDYSWRVESQLEGKVRDLIEWLVIKSV